MIEKITLAEAIANSDLYTELKNVIGIVSEKKAGLMNTNGYIVRSPIDIGDADEESISAALADVILPGFYTLTAGAGKPWQSLFVISGGGLSFSAGGMLQLRCTISGAYIRVAISNTSGSWSSWTKL